MYSWDLGNGITSNQTIGQTEFQVEGTYNVSLTIGDETQGFSTVTKKVTLSREVPVRIANVMTPNGDVKNDALYVENIDRYPNNNVRVYDTDGQEVFAKSGYNNDWNANGVPAGNYICVLKLSLVAKEVKSVVTIIR